MGRLVFHLMMMKRGAVKNRAAVFRTEIDAAWDRPLVESAVGAQPGVEAKTAPGQPHGRSSSQSSHQVLKLSLSGLMDLISAATGGQSCGGADGEKQQSIGKNSRSSHFH
jgi:hypothetical protein